MYQVVGRNLLSHFVLIFLIEIELNHSPSLSSPQLLPWPSLKLLPWPPQVDSLFYFDSFCYIHIIVYMQPAEFIFVVILDANFVL